MKLFKNIFTITFATLFTMSAMAGQMDCRSATYRRLHPISCNGFEENSGTKTLLTLAGGAAIIGVGAALFQNTSGNHGKSTEISNQNTILRSSNVDVNYSQTDFVKNQRISSSYIPSLTNGSDIDNSVIKKIINSEKYQKNYRQMNKINYAYASARGFTGKNNKIVVFDDFNTYHGNAVYNLTEYIAPDAIISKYNLTSAPEKFVSYDAIANIMQQTEKSNIYNNSWQIDSTIYQNAANVIYNSDGQFKTYAEAQQYMYNITSKNFITQIINTAVDNDGIFVWAAGNNSQSESGVLSAMPLAFPELQGHFVNVVALDNFGKIASFSNQCGITQNYCISAPGSFLETDNSGNKVSGTSFAAPIVSGAIAIIKEAFPYMNAKQITELLFVTAQDLGTPGIDSIYGWGLLDLEKATQPVGNPKIVLSNDNIQPLEQSVISGAAASQIKSANVKIAFVDDFGRAFTTNLSENIKVKPYSRAFDKLQEDENDSVVLFDTFEFGFKKFNLLESNGLLESKSNKLTNFVGFKNKFNINNITIYQNLRLGLSGQQTNDNSLISKFSDIYTSSLKTGIQWKDFGLEISIPDTIISGNMYMNIPAYKDYKGNIIYENIHIDLSGIQSFEYTFKYKNLSATFVDNQNYQDEFFIMLKTKKVF
ncbi:MAG: S8 family serine peptidase [Alphaproteobacteria bacterium]|nr:S8 family serine peptidase [Alphaproteobacteria bacterium]